MPAQLPNTISELVEQRIGLAQAVRQRVNLENVLEEVAGGELEAFSRELQDSPESAPPWQRLIQALVIGETYFFRNRTHFDLLKSLILPDIIARRQRQGNRSLSVWSAGCASGEETYSIAITLHEVLPDLAQWDVRLIGTDLNRRALKTAELGIYRNWSFRQTESQFQQQYFTPSGGGLQIKPFIREMVSFRPNNMLDSAPLHGVDVIFCCNVMLYFEKNHVFAVEDQLYDALLPGGWLILGQAEAVQFKRERWTLHIFPGSVVYQKPLLGTRPTVNYDEKQDLPAGRSPAKRKLPKTAALVQTTYGEAVRLMRVKHYEAAEQMLTAILKQAPDNTSARVLFGCLLANRGALDEAHHQLEQVLEADALQADAHYLRGVLFLESGELEAAKEALKSAIYCHRGHALAASILGHLYVQNGEMLRARRVWQEALDNLRDLAAQTPVSDLSDMTAESLSEFLGEQLGENSF